MAVVGELVLVEADGFHLGADFFRDGRIVGEETQEAESVVQVVLENLFTLCVGGVRPVELLAEVSERKDGGLLVVELELTVAAFIEIQNVGEPGVRVVSEPVGEDREAGRIVVCRCGDGCLELGIAGDGEAEVVVHHAGMGVALCVVFRPTGDAGEEFSIRIHGGCLAGLFVETDAGGLLVVG